MHEAVLEDFPDLSGFDCYMAGPPPMVSAGREACLAAGMPEAHMHLIVRLRRRFPRQRGA